MSDLCPYCDDSPALPVTARWEFVLPIEWPNPQHSGRGGSTHLHNSGAGRWAYKRVRDGLTAGMKLAAREHGVTAATCRRRVILTRLWGYRKRAFDRGNLVSGAKPIEDAMVAAGMLVDDRAAFAIIHHKQERNPTGGKRPCDAIRVVIEEIERMQ